MRIGERVKRERIMWGMTQDDLAEATGIDRDKIGKIETGARDVALDELPRFAEVFELSTDALLGRELAGVVYHRLDLSRPATQEAKTWLEECINNSLFLHRLERVDAG